MTEIKLHDNSRLIFQWVRVDLLNIECWKPGNDARGLHGWLLQGSALLAGEDLKEFLDELQIPEGQRPAA
jgi:hypothetical protein